MADLPLRQDSACANPVPPLADSNRDGTRSAPRVPAGRDSLAAAFASMHEEMAA